MAGDGSYDNKNRIGSNTSFIPCFESPNSVSILSSYVSDDYFGFLDINEAAGVGDLMDIGVGRLPVRNRGEAGAVVTKIIHYDRVGSTLNSQGQHCSNPEDLNATHFW